MANQIKSNPITPLVKELLGDLDARSRDVIEKRFGLMGKAHLTLAEIGNQYNITRERVRQIEALALKEARSYIEKTGLKSFVEVASGTLKNYRGIRRADLLGADLKENYQGAATDAVFSNTVHFILEASGKMEYTQTDIDWYAHWHLGKNDRKTAEAIIQKSYKALKGSKEVVLAGTNFDELFKNLFKSEGITQTVGENYLATSKKFAKNHFGDFGLSEWAEIKPKTARDWAYLILKKNNKPLHFQEIASKISEYRTGKKTNFQTVHNELIKDNRFVLVGRGLYGLREFNILPGTAREVISHFLKKNGPLSFVDLKTAIGKERDFKENTVLINLQNKAFFKKLDDGRYTLTEV
ncbi:MAG: hypothetical protein COU08_02770 [Candidatus Harrisonbacteria bacterium CG10_big_fil_rev_8_21_14_0_10_42_17]|uniref:HTH HARE-type domain-containing protein n=1 Tax=Candidatus Harrisonbacteria bacterium CG10_big_fil_rev_8_21_14_0_10_42_17 TaxID=1974584 RepID=A0A2M6WHY0_9BACT|nr:MAG: hypothetical protein COU08_02770 [Candidatus Harrisonbacteria bacterium CG10_big_fil_rev_8_21_14_0_10_42_17]